MGAVGVAGAVGARGPMGAVGATGPRGAKGVGGGTIRHRAYENKPENMFLMFRQEEARESEKPGEDGHHQVHTIGDCELRSLLINL